MDVLPPNHAYCVALKQHSIELVTQVNKANLKEIKRISKIVPKQIVRDALSNFIAKSPLTKTEFSIHVYNDCVSRRGNRSENFN